MAAIGIQRDANAGRDADRLPGQLERRAQCLADTLGHARRIARVVHVL